MMRRILLSCCLFACSSIAFGQELDPLSVLKREVGKWECDVYFYVDPSGKPIASKATEVNHMVGDLWLISDFQGEMGGTPFHGSSQMGFDPSSKKYVGSWVDSASPFAMRMEGSFEASTKTLTVLGTGKDPAGNEMKSKLVSTAKDDDHRSMTMYMSSPGGEWTKFMEVVYRRK
jgi:hypothetical protein